MADFKMLLILFILVLEVLMRFKEYLREGSENKAKQ